jgi:hypothetical protein
MFNDARRDAELARVRDGQIESAALVAKEALDQKFGKESVDRLMPKMGKRLGESPHLVPEQAMTSPSALAHALQDVYRLAKQDAQAEDDANHWDKVKASNSSVPRVWR